MNHDPSHDNELTGVIIGAAIEVHRQLGPELDEAAYEDALSRKLHSQGIQNRRQVPLPLIYQGVKLDCGYRLDLLVQERLPVELKAVHELLRVHEAQLLTYQRLGGYPLALLMNFNVAVLKDGLKRMAETRHSTPPSHEGPADEPLRDDRLTHEVVLAAIEVHRHLGPGLLESSYLACLCHELTQRRVPFECCKEVPLHFDGEVLSATAEIPLLVAGELPVFPLSTASLRPLHTSAALARLRQGAWKRGLVLNFNSVRLLDGIKRVSL